MVRKTVRPPTGRPPSNPTPPPPPISFGTRELKVLGYIVKLGNERFNIRQYGLETGTPRSTVRDTLKRLQSMGMVEGYGHGTTTSTKKGKRAIEGVGIGVGQSRRGGRGKVNLSNHFLKYRLPIISTKFTKELMQNTHPNDTRSVKLPNRTDYILYFDDATIIIKTKEVVISIHEIVTADQDSATLEGLNRLIEYTKKLDKLRIVTDGAILESGHYSRVLSSLSEHLEKIDKRYFLEFSNGRKFWIDNSNDSREDETNDREIRENVDKVMTEICTGELMNNITALKLSHKELDGLLCRVVQVELAKQGILKETQTHDQSQTELRSYTL
jgi:hypothetical protein